MRSNEMAPDGEIGYWGTLDQMFQLAAFHMLHGLKVKMFDCAVNMSNTWTKKWH